MSTSEDDEDEQLFQRQLNEVLARSKTDYLSSKAKELQDQEDKNLLDAQQKSLEAFYAYHAKDGNTNNVDTLVVDGKLVFDLSDTTENSVTKITETPVQPKNKHPSEDASAVPGSPASSDDDKKPAAVDSVPDKTINEKNTQQKRNPFLSEDTDNDSESLASGDDDKKPAPVDFVQWLSDKVNEDRTPRKENPIVSEDTKNGSASTDTQKDFENTTTTSKNQPRKKLNRTQIRFLRARESQLAYEQRMKDQNSQVFKMARMKQRTKQFLSKKSQSPSKRNDKK